MRRSPRNVRISCNHAGLSHFSGSYFFQEFLRVLHFRYFLAEQIRYPRRNRDYSISQMLLALVYPIVLGLDRIENGRPSRPFLADWREQHCRGIPPSRNPADTRSVRALYQRVSHQASERTGPYLPSPLHAFRVYILRLTMTEA
jgi:hypothetical protein